MRFIHLELGRSLIWGQLFHENYVELSSVLNESSTNEKRNPIKSLWLRSLRYLQPLGIKCLCNYTCNSNSLCTHHKLKLIIEHSTAIYSHFKRGNLARLTRQSFTVSTLWKSNSQITLKFYLGRYRALSLALSSSYTQQWG